MIQHLMRKGPFQASAEMTTSLSDNYLIAAGTHSALDDLSGNQEMTSPRPVSEVPTEAVVVQVLSGQAAFLAITTIYCIVCVISVFGIILNIINIIVFIKLGVQKETMNIGLCALSIADLTTLISLLLMGFVNSPLYTLMNIPMAPYDVTLLLTGLFMPTSVTSHCITAMISFERCVCVLKPFQVKRIITVNRVRAAVVGIFVVTHLGAVPKYATTNLEWRKVPGSNSSQLQFEYTPLMRQVEEITIQVMNVLIPFLTYLLMVVFTIILVVKLRQAMFWRAKFARMATKPNETGPRVHPDSSVATTSTDHSTKCDEKELSGRGIVEETGQKIPPCKQDKLDVPSGNGKGVVSRRNAIVSDRASPQTASNKVEFDMGSESSNIAHAAVTKVGSIEENKMASRNSNVPTNISVRELKVLKSVILICIIFLTCTSPTVILITMYLVWPKFHVDTEEFQNLMHLLISFPFLTQAISSSINIVFYMRMSSRFRPVCSALLRPCSRK